MFENNRTENVCDWMTLCVPEVSKYEWYLNLFCFYLCTLMNECGVHSNSMCVCMYCVYACVGPSRQNKFQVDESPVAALCVNAGCPMQRLYLRPIRCCADCYKNVSTSNGSRCAGVRVFMIWAARLPATSAGTYIFKHFGIFFFLLFCLWCMHALPKKSSDF